MTETSFDELGQPVGAPVERSLPRPRPDRSAMVGRWSSLVPLDPVTHAEALFEADRSDPQGRSWTYLPYGPFETLEDYRAWMRSVCGGDDPLFHAIRDAHDRAVGVASYLRITPGTGVIEIGHLHYSPALQRTAAGTEAVYLMMRRAFDELGYRRCEWKCDALNEASRRAALRLGFAYEGTFRQATVVKGRNRDTAWFALIDEDWPAVRHGLAAWLAPDNFDAAGRQRTRLRAEVGPALS